MRVSFEEMEKLFEVRFRDFKVRDIFRECAIGEISKERALAELDKILVSIKNDVDNDVDALKKGSTHECDRAEEY